MRLLGCRVQFADVNGDDCWRFIDGYDVGGDAFYDVLITEKYKATTASYDNLPNCCRYDRMASKN